MGIKDDIQREKAKQLKEEQDLANQKEEAAKREIEELTKAARPMAERYLASIGVKGAKFTNVVPQTKNDRGYNITMSEVKTLNVTFSHPDLTLVYRFWVTFHIDRSGRKASLDVVAAYVGDSFENKAIKRLADIDDKFLK
jgi:hypothetical protein